MATGQTPQGVLSPCLSTGSANTPSLATALSFGLLNLRTRLEILARARLLKEVEKFKKMFISPDLTRKQQEKDKELIRQLKLIRETGVMGARIKNGKVIKNETGGREIVLFQFPTQK
jgi:hypothetical protein